MAKASGWPLNRYETLALLIFSSVLAVDLWFWELLFGTAVNWASLAGSWIDQLKWPILTNNWEGRINTNLETLLYKWQCKENIINFCLDLSSYGWNTAARHCR
jgi:hypothetical protein